MKKIILSSVDSSEDILNYVHDYLYQVMNNVNDYLYSNGYHVVADSKVKKIVDGVYNSIEDELTESKDEWRDW